MCLLLLDSVPFESAIVYYAAAQKWLYDQVSVVYSFVAAVYCVAADVYDLATVVSTP